MHLIVMPLGALLFGILKRPIHQLPPKRLVDVNKAQPPEGRQDQIFFDLFNFAERDNIPADGVIDHNGDTVICSACAVVEVFAAAQSCTCPD